MISSIARASQARDAKLCSSGAALRDRQLRPNDESEISEGIADLVSLYRSIADDDPELRELALSDLGRWASMIWHKVSQAGDDLSKQLRHLFVSLSQPCSRSTQDEGPKGLLRYETALASVAVHAVLGRIEELMRLYRESEADGLDRRAYPIQSSPNDLLGALTERSHSNQELEERVLKEAAERIGLMECVRRHIRIFKALGTEARTSTNVGLPTTGCRQHSATTPDTGQSH